ncbi:MAG: hypothetical protein ACHQZR_08535 [Candidatus Limnocylindrales bacterium]
MLAAVAMSVLALILSATALFVTLSRPTIPAAAAPSASDVAVGPTFTPLPTLAAPTATAGDTADAGPSPTLLHLAPALEALLPHSVNGVNLSSQSTTGTAGLGTDASSTALIASLKGLGKTPADLQIGEAYDDSGTIDLSVTDFQVTGVDPATLRQAIIASWLAAGSSGVSTTQQTVGQKPVTTVDYGDGSADDYMYVHGPIVFDVSTSDPDLAAQVLTQLP